MHRTCLKPPASSCKVLQRSVHTNRDLFNLVDNLKYRSHTSPVWAASKYLLRNTFLLRASSNTSVTIPDADASAPTQFIEQTSDWTITYATQLGVQISQCSSIEKLFPVSGVDTNSIQLTQLVLDIIEKVPSATTPQEYMYKYGQVYSSLRNEHLLVSIFATSLFQVCKNLDRETHVDDLMVALLIPAEFSVPPLFFRQKPHIEYSAHGRRLVSKPDFGIYVTPGEGDEGIMLPEIAAIALEGKVLDTSDLGVGQVIGSSTAAAITNLSVHGVTRPVAAIRPRGHFLSFMNSQFNAPFLNQLFTGQKEDGASAVIEVFPPRPKRGRHVGYNLLEKEQRKQAFTALALLRQYVLSLTS